jgi:very-short-patch-repair endonuclease
MIKTFWPLLLIIVIGIIVKFIIENSSKDSDKKPDFSVFLKKQYLFDTPSEFYLYKVLFELFGDKYYIFPQVNYSHLIEPKKSTFQEERKNRSRIDRKSADFVLCDKEKIIPQLVIELDGSVHNTRSKQARDEFIDELTGIVGLPILHIKTSNVEKEFIRSEINKKLGL